MGIVSALRCPKCAGKPESKTVFRCPACGSILEVKVEIGHLARSDLQVMSHSRDRGFWRWFDFFPIESRASIVSLGEGSTPLIHATRLGERLGMGRVFLKNKPLCPPDRSKTAVTAWAFQKRRNLASP